MAFNPNDHLRQLKSDRGGESQDYLEVKWRLVWFNEQCPNGKITLLKSSIQPDLEVAKETFAWNKDTRQNEKVTKRAKGWAYFEVRIDDGQGKVAEAAGSETAVDFTDYIEKANTKAVGRALAMIGYGTQFAPEFNEGDRIVDAPVDRPSTKAQQNGHKPEAKGESQGHQQPAPAPTSKPAPAPAPTPAPPAPVTAQGTTKVIEPEPAQMDAPENTTAAQRKLALAKELGSMGPFERAAFFRETKRKDEPGRWTDQEVEEIETEFHLWDQGGGNQVWMLTTGLRSHLDQKGNAKDDFGRLFKAVAGERVKDIVKVWKTTLNFTKTINTEATAGEADAFAYALAKLEQEGGHLPDEITTSYIRERLSRCTMIAEAAAAASAAGETA